MLGGGDATTSLSVHPACAPSSCSSTCPRVGGLDEPLTCFECSSSLLESVSAEDFRDTELLLESNENRRRGFLFSPPLEAIVFVKSPEYKAC